jgi:phage N-6-adenine-methyltransferase
MFNESLWTSETDEWSTPDAFFDRLNDEFHFTLDACATAENAKCIDFFNKETDGLLNEWRGRVFMNPPYGTEIGKWVRTAYGEVKYGRADVVVCLLPARTDTAWWHDYCMRGEIRFIRGRLKFGGSKNSAPFPSAVVIFRNLRA